MHKDKPTLNLDALRDSVAFSVRLSQAAIDAIDVGTTLDPAGDAALVAARGYVACGARNNALRRAAMDAYRAAQRVGAGPAFHALHSVSAAAGAAFLHPPGGSTDAHQTKHILGAAVQYVLCIEASGGDSAAAFGSVMTCIPDAIKELLRMYPEPVAGKQRYGAVLVMLYRSITQSE